MSLDLLNQLEAKVQTTVDALNLLRQEVNELKEENASLKEEKLAWESKLGELLDKFSHLEASVEETTEEAEAATDDSGHAPQVSSWS